MSNARIFYSSRAIRMALNLNSSPPARVPVSPLRALHNGFLLDCFDAIVFPKQAHKDDIILGTRIACFVTLYRYSD